jgi:hypothetical protein
VWRTDRLLLEIKATTDDRRPTTDDRQRLIVIGERR